MNSYSRDSILSNLPACSTEPEETAVYDYIGDILDHFEEQMSEIADLLAIEGLEDLSCVEEAHNLAVKIKDELY